MKKIIFLDFDGVLTKKESIEQWLQNNEWDKYVILDDAEIGMANSYQTNKVTGLTAADADRVIEMLNNNQSE